MNESSIALVVWMAGLNLSGGAKGRKGAQVQSSGVGGQALSGTILDGEDERVITDIFFIRDTYAPKRYWTLK